MTATYCHGVITTTIPLLDLMSRLPAEAKLSAESICKNTDHETSDAMTLEEMKRIEDICLEDTDIEARFAWSCSHGGDPGDYMNPPDDPDLEIDGAGFEVTILGVTEKELDKLISVTDFDLWSEVYDDFSLVEGDC